MAQTIGYQRGSQDWTAAQALGGNTPFTVFTNTTSGPMRVINAGCSFNLILGYTAQPIRSAMFFGVYPNNSSANATMVAAKIVCSATASSGFDMGPSGSGDTLESSWVPANGAYSQKLALTQSSNGTNTVFNQRAFDYQIKGVGAALWSLNNDYGVYEINPPYFWLLPGDSLQVKVLNTSDTPPNTGQPCRVSWNFVTVAEV